MKKIFFIRPVTQYDNLGDVIINRELLSLLPENVDLVIGNEGIPEWFTNEITRKTNCKFILKSTSKFYICMLKSLLTRNSIFILDTPGHQFYNEVSLKANVNARLKKILSWLGINYLKLGVSMGPYSTKAIALENYKSKFYRYIGIRERFSLEYVGNNNFSNFKYFPDLAINLPTNQSGGNEDAIALSFRIGITGTNAKVYDDNVLLSDMKSISDEFSFTFLSQVKYDDEYVLRLSKHLNAGDSQIVLSSADEGMIFNALGKAKYTISNRLHVLLFALSQGSIPIPYIDKAQHTKVTGVFEDIELDFLIFDIKDNEGLKKHLLNVKRKFENIDVDSLLSPKRDFIKSEFERIIE